MEKHQFRELWFIDLLKMYKFINDDHCRKNDLGYVIAYIVRMNNVRGPRYESILFIAKWAFITASEPKTPHDTSIELRHFCKHLIKKMFFKRFSCF